MEFFKKSQLVFKMQCKNLLKSPFHVEIQMHRNVKIFQKTSIK